MGGRMAFEHPARLTLVQEPFFRVWMASILPVPRAQWVGVGSSLTNGSTPFFWPQGLVQKEHMTQTGQIKSSPGAGAGTLGERAPSSGSRIL